MRTQQRNRVPSAEAVWKVASEYPKGWKSSLAFQNLIHYRLECMGVEGRQGYIEWTGKITDLLGVERNDKRYNKGVHHLNAMKNAGVIAITKFEGRRERLFQVLQDHEPVNINKVEADETIYTSPKLTRLYKASDTFFIISSDIWDWLKENSDENDIWEGNAKKLPRTLASAGYLVAAFRGLKKTGCIKQMPRTPGLGMYDKRWKVVQPPEQEGYPRLADV